MCVCVLSFKPICLHLNFNTRETFSCKNFYFSIHIPGQLTLKEYNQTVLLTKKSVHLFFPVWVLVFCLFENREVKLSVTKLKLYLKHFNLHIPLLFRRRTKIASILFVFYFCFLNFSIYWKYPLVCSNIISYHMKKLQKQNYISWNINNRNVGENVYSFLLISISNLVKKQR